MEQEGITVLARECAKECIDPYGFSRETYEELVEEKAESITFAFRWLDSRYYLVEKNKVKQLKQCFGSEEVYEVIDMLFPEIAKEVEE